MADGDRDHGRLPQHVASAASEKARAIFAPIVGRSASATRKRTKAARPGWFADDLDSLGHSFLLV